LTTTEQNAIRILVSQLKSNSLWDLLETFYPFVGTSAGQQKLNLRNPADTDAAFRLTFSGGWTHSSSGLIGNGIDSWARTHWNNTRTLTGMPGVGDTGRGVLIFGVHILNDIPNTNPGSIYADIQPYVGSIPYNSDNSVSIFIEGYRQNGTRSCWLNQPMDVSNRTVGFPSTNCIFGSYTDFTIPNPGPWPNNMQGTLNHLQNCGISAGTTLTTRNYFAANIEIVLGTSSRGGNGIYTIGQYNAMYIFRGFLGPANFTSILQTFKTNLGR
jgi:hypothetical protein